MFPELLEINKIILLSFKFEDIQVSKNIINVSRVG